MQFIHQGEPADRLAVEAKCREAGATLTDKPHWYCPDDPDAVVVICHCGYEIHTTGTSILRFGPPCKGCREATKAEFDEIIAFSFQ